MIPIMYHCVAQAERDSGLVNFKTTVVLRVHKRLGGGSAALFPFFPVASW